MDLLEQYKQANPSAFQAVAPQAPRDPYGREYGFFVRLAMRASGGRIRTAAQANAALLAAAAVFMAASLFFFLRSSGPSLPPPAQILNDTPASGLRSGAGAEQ